MDQKQQRPASISEDARYRILVESITDYAIYMLDPEGHVINWNAGAQRFKGYAAPEILGKNFPQFYLAEDREKGLPQRALGIAAAEGKFEAEGWRVRKDGSTFWAHVVIDPIRDDRGDLIGYAKITRDLTERRETEAMLKRSEQQFRMLVEGVTDYAIYMLDPEGRVSSWNAGANRIKGYAPSEIIGEHFSRFYTPEDQAGEAPRLALETARREGRFAKEGWRVRKDGSRFWASVVIDPIHDDDGTLVGFAKVTRDLTEREEVQRELELAREALFHSQKMDALGQLTGGVAHDFNNLLMATLSSLELLRKRLPEDPQSKKLLDNAVEAARRGATLTQRMLAFARRQDLDLASIEMPALIQGMEDLIRRALGPTMQLELRLPASLPAVTADANQLEMALLNLVVNARDAMSDGGTVIISGEVEEVGERRPDGLAAGRYVRMCVIDDGSGMDADTLSRALEPFFTTKGVGKGTGLGLSMIHGLAEQSGGRFTLESKPGEGTTAVLWLPVAEAATMRRPAQPAPQPVSEERKLKVLAVDDDSLVLMNTVALLEDLGHTVFDAWSGEEALAIFEREPDIDLVVTDQAMPNMTGVQLVEQLFAKRPDIPVILATGYGELPVDASGNMHKLGKPFGQADLARAVTAAMAPVHRGPGGESDRVAA